MVKPIDDYGELLCPECNMIIRCDDCGDMPDKCPQCGEVIDYTDYAQIDLTFSEGVNREDY